MPGLLHQPKVRFRPPSTWAFLRWRQLGAVLFVTKASRNVHRITLASWRGLQCPFVVWRWSTSRPGFMPSVVWTDRVQSQCRHCITKSRPCMRQLLVIQTGCCRLCVSYRFKQVVVCTSFTRDSDRLLSAVQVVVRALATDSNRLLFVRQLLIQTGFCSCVSYWFKQVVCTSVTDSDCSCVSYWFKQVVVCASVTDSNRLFVRQLLGFKQVVVVVAFSSWTAVRG